MTVIQTAMTDQEGPESQYFPPTAFFFFLPTKQAQQKIFKAKRMQSITFFITMLAAGPPQPYFSNLDVQWQQGLLVGTMRQVQG